MDKKLDEEQGLWLGFGWENHHRHRNDDGESFVWRWEEEEQNGYFRERRGHGEIK